MTLPAPCERLLVASIEVTGAEENEEVKLGVGFWAVLPAGFMSFTPTPEPPGGGGGLVPPVNADPLNGVPMGPEFDPALIPKLNPVLVDCWPLPMLNPVSVVCWPLLKLNPVLVVCWPLPDNATDVEATEKAVNPPLIFDDVAGAVKLI